MEPGNEERKLAHLDGLRGLAALVVVFHHFACAFLPAAIFGGAIIAHFSLEKVIYKTPLQLLVTGNFAVCIFFVLSGYVLSHKFFLTKDVTHARSGAIKRYFRLMPPILAAILISYLLLRLKLPHNMAGAKISGSSMWLANLWPRPAGFMEVLRQGTYGILVGKADPNIFDNALWTMKLEFFGSFLVFAFIALFGNIKRRWVAYLAVIILFWNSYYLAFILGVLLCDLGVAYPKHKFSRVTLLLAGGTGLLLGAAPLASSTQTIYSSLTIPLLPTADIFVLPHIIGAALILMTVVYSRTLSRLLSVKPLRYLGKISFSMYLLHILILGTVTSAVLVLMAPNHSYLAALAVAALVSFPVIFIAAHFFTKYVDTPAVKISSKLNKRWFLAKGL